MVKRLDLIVAGVSILAGASICAHGIYNGIKYAREDSVRETAHASEAVTGCLLFSMAADYIRKYRR